MAFDNDRAWIEQRIARCEAQIIETEDAISAIESGKQSYSLTTADTQEVVTRANLASLRELLSSLENRRATLRARLHGAGITVKPGF